MYQIEDDFVACAGTLIYKGCIGEKALAEIFHDLGIRTLKEIRQSLWGSYVIIYKKNHQINVFVDETGTYAFYYYRDAQGNYLFTNTFYHIERMAKQPVNQLAFIEQELEYSILDNQTPYENIYRVLGTEVITVDLETNKIAVRPIELNRYELREKTIDSIAECINRCAQDIILATKDLLDTPYIFLTGGVDSRLILANYIKAGMKPVLGSWFNGSYTMNTKKEDFMSVKAIADVTKLEVLPIDVEEGKVDFGEGFFDQCEKFGEYASIYAGNVKWHNILEENKIEYVDYGFFGETLKEWVALEEIGKKKVNIKWFLQVYIRRLGYSNMEHDISCYQDLYNRLFKEFSDIARLEKIDVNNMSREDCMTLYYWYRLHADTVLYQYANMYGYSFPVYAQKEIADYINAVPYEMKEHEKINLYMEEMLAKDLLNIPFYSHCQYMVYDERKKELKVKALKAVTRYISSQMQKNKLGKKLWMELRSWAWKTGKEETGREYISTAIEVLKNSPTFLKLNIKIDEHSILYLPTLLQLALSCRMADMLVEEVK